MEQISAADLVPMDLFFKTEPITIDLVYANKNHPRNVFGCALYKADARLWLHKDLAGITLLAARSLFETRECKIELKDGLRTTEAQKQMNETEIVKANPHWTAPGPKRLISPPGMGGHPRGMAVDVILKDIDGNEIDMGTPFDYLTEDPQDNPAARSYTGFSDDILKNRKILEQAFLDAADDLGIPVLPLHAEWWDFRLPPDISDHYVPLSDYGLPNAMKMTSTEGPDHPCPDFDKTAQDVLKRVSNANL